MVEVAGVEVAGGQPEALPATVQLHRHRPGVRVDDGDGGEVAVEHADAPVVAGAQHPVADGEVPPARGQARPGEPAGGLQPAADAGVEVVDVDAAGGEHHPHRARGAVVVGGEPVVDEPLTHLVGGGGGGDTAVVGERGDALGGIPVAQRVEGSAFPGVVLAAVVGQLDGGQSGAQAAEIPPASISGSWRWSPTSTTFACAISA
jgi:hypothetical protein